jgi:hypothetical protein
MPRRFLFADAFWFRLPLRVLIISVAVFALVSLYPAFVNGTSQDHERAIMGLMVVAGFVVTGTVFSVAINDGYVELDADRLYIRFEAFFTAEIPIADIVAVRRIDPQPRWRYRFGLGTNFEDRISCSHGGSLVELELARAWRTRVWPRHIAARRFWLAVGDLDGFIAEVERAIAPAQRRQERLAA